MIAEPCIVLTKQRSGSQDYTVFFWDRQRKIWKALSNENEASLYCLQWLLLCLWASQQLDHFWIRKEPDQCCDWRLKSVMHTSLGALGSLEGSWGMGATYKFITLLRYKELAKLPFNAGAHREHCIVLSLSQTTIKLSMVFSFNFSLSFGLKHNLQSCLVAVLLNWTSYLQFSLKH